MSHTERTCPRCGMVFPSDKLDDLCPACLLANVLDTEETEDGPAFWEEETAKPADARRSFSHFDLMDELGRGGMGVVYRARDLNTQRTVALKVLQAHHLEVPDLVRRFRSEVRAVSSLDHPHVLPIHEVGEYQGIPFFSMKLTTGGSLAERIGVYLGKPREAAQLLAKVARGVQHAHERGILHRDLKPGNILLDAAGDPYVCDFGLAKWVEDDRRMTMTAAVLGTPHYIAPEQAAGSKGLTPAVDIYSLGAILYELLTGRPPFVGGSVIETLVASQEKSPDPPSSIARNVPHDLETICLKALQHDPNSRYASAGAFADDLEAWVEGRAIKARPIGAAGQLWRWAKRNPLPAVLLSALMILIGATAVASTFAAVRFEQERTKARTAESQAVEARSRAEDRLYDALLAQARASRLSGEAGQRFRTLEIVQQAAALKRTIHLRNEAIAALTLPDLKIDRHFNIRRNAAKQPFRYGPNLETAVLVGESGDLVHLTLESGAVLNRVPPRATHPSELFVSSSRYAAVVYANGELVVWDLSAAREVLALPPHHILAANTPRYASELCFADDESLVALCTSDNQVEIYRLPSGEKHSVLRLSEPGKVLCFSQDAQRIAVVSGAGRLELWQTAGGKKPEIASSIPRVVSLDWSGDRIAGAGIDYNVYVWDSRTLERVHSLAGHRQEVTQVAFHPQGDLVASTSRDKTVQLWDLKTGSRMVSIPGLGAEPSLRFSADGKRIGTADYTSNAIVLSFNDGESLLQAAAPSRSGDFATLVSSLDFSPDGRSVALASFRALTLYQTNPLDLRLEIPSASDEKSVRFLDDRRILVAARSSPPQVFELNRTSADFALTPVRNVALPSGYILGSPGPPGVLSFTHQTNGTVHFVDARTLEVKQTLSNYAEVWDAISLPQSGQVLLSFSNYGPDSVYLVAGEKRGEIAAGAGAVLCLNPDGSRLLTTGHNGALIWSTSDWRPQVPVKSPIDPMQVSSGTFSPDGRYLALVANSIVWITDAQTGEPYAALGSHNSENQEYRVRFSPDAAFLALQGQDNSIRLWNLHLLQNRLRSLNLAWESPTKHK